MYFDTSRFALTAVLEKNWRRIYEEYLSVRDLLTDWRGKRLYDEGWKTYLLYEFPAGEALSDNVARCPFTASLVSEHAPGHGVVAFSVLLPQARVKPHADYSNAFVRCHLPLQVPEGDCGIKVGGEVRPWVPGQAVMFDHTALHETWNLTDAERVILLVDFVPEPGALEAGSWHGSPEPAQA